MRKLLAPSVFLILATISIVILANASFSHKREDTKNTVNSDNEFKILTTKSAYGGHSEVFADVTNNNEIDAAVYERNKATEKELGINIKQIYLNDSVATLVNEALSENATADLVVMELKGVFSEIIASNASVLLDLTDKINLSETWYNQNCIKDLSVKGRVYAVTGAYTFSSVDAIRVVAYDKAAEKQLLESKSLDVPLSEIVENGTWTLELFEFLSRESLSLGYSASTVSSGSALALCIGAGTKSFEKVGDDIPKIVVGSDSFKNVFSEIHEIVNKLSSPLSNISENDYEASIFSEDTGPAFSIITLGEYVESNNGDFGILPLPKRNVYQTSYVNPVDVSLSCAAGVLATSKDTDFALKVLDSLFKKSSEIVSPAYYASVSTIDGNFDKLQTYITGNQSFDVVDMFGWGNISELLDEELNDPELANYDKAMAERSAAAEFSMSVLLDRFSESIAD